MGFTPRLALAHGRDNCERALSAIAALSLRARFVIALCPSISTARRVGSFQSVGVPRRRENLRRTRPDLP